MKTWVRIDDVEHALLYYDRPNFRLKFECGRVQQDTAKRELRLVDGVPGVHTKVDWSFDGYCVDCLNGRKAAGL